MKTTKFDPLSGWRLPAALFALSVLLHTAVSHLLVPYPTNLIDETLYANIARSVARGEGLLFKGQPSDYTYILYSLVLSPVYALFGPGAPFFRIIQCLNAVLFSSALFPLYALSRETVTDNKKITWVLLAFILMPDSLLTGFILSENLFYPLFFLAVYLFVLYRKDPKPGYIIPVGLLGGLLYETKPGYAVLPAVCLIAALITALKKEKRNLIPVLLAMAAGILILPLFSLLRSAVFRQEAVGLFSVYAVQIGADSLFQSPDASLQIEAFFKGLLLSPYYILIACGGFCVVLPFLFRKRFAPGQRSLFRVLCVSLLLTIVGTAWIINRSEYYAFAVHTRYYASFFPLFLVLTLSLTEDPKPSPAKKTWLPTAILGGFALVCAFWCLDGIYKTDGAFMGVSSNTAIQLFRPIPDSLEIPFGILMAALIAGMCILIRGGKLPALKRYAAISFLAMACLNTVCSVAFFDYDPAITSSDKSAGDLLYDQNYMIVSGSLEPATKTALLDVNDHRSVTGVTINDLYNALNESEGVYRPFVPQPYRGMASTVRTPEVAYLAFDRSVVNYIGFSSAVGDRSDPSLPVSVVSVPAGERFADSVLGGIVAGKLDRGSMAFIRVFDPGITSARLELDLGMAASGTLSVTCDAVTETLSLMPGRQTCAVDLSGPPVTAVILQSADSDVSVYGYRLIR